VSVARTIVAVFAFLALGALPASAQQGQNIRAKPEVGLPDDSLKGPPIFFYADLSADEESSYTESPGVGRFEITWKVTYSNTTSPVTSAGIHGPQTAGSEAAVLVDLGKKGLGSPIEGSAVLNEGDLEYLLTGKMYVNLHTVKYPGGELRGQLMRQRAKAPTS
jgi:hypothetical protein